MKTKMKDISCIGSANKQLASSWYLYLLLFIGLCVFGIGMGSIFFLDNLVRTKLADGLVLRPNSEVVKQWSNPPADLYMEIYLMNITNPEEAALGISKPKLVDQGPYTFRETRNKANVTFHRNKTVSFTEPMFYYFDRERSVGPLTDKVTQLDLVVAGMSHKFARCYGGTDCLMRNMVETVLPSLGMDFATELFKNQKRSIFKTYTVGDLLWGHEDPFLKKMAPYASMMGEKDITTVGLFEGKNGTASGVYTVFSGEGNITAYQKIVAFNGMTKMTAWSTPYANMMNGTVGHAFRPFLKAQENIEVFAGDLCRSSELAFEKTQLIKGVEMFVYKPPRWGSVPWPRNQEQAGFCTPDTSDCPPEGLMNETACIGQPILMSKPHFLHCDPRLAEAFEGMHPDEINHDTFLYIEPLTGSVLAASKRLMFLFPFRESFLTKAANIRLTPNMPDGTLAFPMFWVNESALAHDPAFNQIRNLAYPAMAAARIVPHLLVATGIAITVVSAGLLLWGFCRQAQRSHGKYDVSDPKKASSRSPVPVLMANSPEAVAFVPKLESQSPENYGNGYEVLYSKSQAHRASQTGHSRNASSGSCVIAAAVGHSDNARVPNFSQQTTTKDPLLEQR